MNEKDTPPMQSEQINGNGVDPNKNLRDKLVILDPSSPSQDGEGSTNTPERVDRWKPKSKSVEDQGVLNRENSDSAPDEVGVGMNIQGNSNKDSESIPPSLKETVSDFLKIVGPFIGGENDKFRTFKRNSFTTLGVENKRSVYESVTGAIDVLIKTNDTKYLEVMNKFYLVGEPGISFVGDELHIGPNTTRDDIVTFLKTSSPKQETQIDLSEENTPEPSDTEQPSVDKLTFARNNASEDDPMVKRLKFKVGDLGVVGKGKTKEEKEGNNPLETLRSLGFEVGFRSVYNHDSNTYKEEKGDPSWAKNVLEAVKIINSSPGEAGFDRVFISEAYSDTFYTANLLDPTKRDLYLNPNDGPQLIVDFVRFAKEECNKRVESGGDLNPMVSMGEFRQLQEEITSPAPAILPKFILGRELGGEETKNETAQEKFEIAKINDAEKNPLAKAQQFKVGGVPKANESAEKFEFIDGIKVDTSLYDVSENHDIKSEIDGAVKDLKKSEKDLLVSSGLSFVIKGPEVLYPVYHEEQKVLNIGLHNEGEDIKNVIRNTVIPNLGSIVKEKTPSGQTEKEPKSFVEKLKEATTIEELKNILSTTQNAPEFYSGEYDPKKYGQPAIDFLNNFGSLKNAKECIDGLKGITRQGGLRQRVAEITGVDKKFNLGEENITYLDLSLNGRSQKGDEYNPTITARATEPLKAKDGSSFGLDKRNGKMPRMGNIINIDGDKTEDTKDKEGLVLENPQVIFHGDGSVDENRRTDGMVGEKNTEQKEQEIKPFNADDMKDAPKAPIAEDISDILNQPEAKKEEPKPVEVLSEDAEILELGRLRNKLAQAEARKKNSSISATSLDITLGDIRNEYEASKEKVGRMLRERLIGVAGGPLTREQESLVNDALFEEIIKKETDSYIEALKEARIDKGGMVNKLQEGMRSFLSQNTVQWYLKQNKYKRLGAIAVLATIGVGAGAFIGGATAGTVFASGIGAGVYRGARGLASMGAMVGIGKVGKKSIEKIDEEETQKLEEIRNSNKSLQEKAEDFLKVREEANKKRRKVRIATSAIGVAGGIGTGIATGAGLDIAGEYYKTGSFSSVLESRMSGFGRPNLNTPEDRINRGAFVAPVDEGSASGASDALDDGGSKGESKAIVANETKVTPKDTPQTRAETGQEGLDKTSKGPSSEVENENKGEAGNDSVDKKDVLVEAKEFSSPEFVHEFKKEDTNWGTIKNILENTKEEFKNLKHSGQKSFVISHLNNKILENRGDYGFGPNGEVVVGTKVDYSKLFKGEEKWVNEIIEKSKNLSDERIGRIETNDKLLENWVKSHRGERLTGDNVDKIIEEGRNAVVQGKGVVSDSDLQKEFGDMLDYEEGQNTSVKMDQVENGSKVEAQGQNAGLQRAIEKEMKDSGVEIGADETSPVAKSLVSKESLNIEDLAETSGQKEGILSTEAVSDNIGRVLADKRSDGLRSMVADEKLYVTEAVNNVEVNTIFEKGVDEIYGKKGFFRSRAGVDTEEWKTMSGLPADKVIQYFRNPQASVQGGIGKFIPPKILEEISNSDKHKLFVQKELTGLIDAVNHKINVRESFGPSENENVETFVKRGIGMLVKK